MANRLSFRIAFAASVLALSAGANSSVKERFQDEADSVLLAKNSQPQAETKDRHRASKQAGPSIRIQTERDKQGEREDAMPGNPAAPPASPPKPDKELR
ncbi:hypothetical protein [Thioflavicoccus mobilis]|uniref:hypothetical protein n=1 Tax=Thioflavicoccus mobilis TaxID=80679 RepID=UPI0012F86723|nr:hypothetical protein [Thioflavicoccus mobilis]